MTEKQNEQDKREEFRYTYSAREQEEVQKIRRKYAPPQEDKMEHLRRLDQSVYRKARAASIFFGVAGTLIMGIGMCYAMVWQGIWFIPGIVIGLVGVAVLALAYPVYNRVVQKERERIAPEILRLTDELLR